jgi:tRNA threonylcarbamoyladenosine biosynthesis protein TsaB
LAFDIMPDILLAIDTCTRRSAIALRDATALRAEIAWETDRHHTAAVSQRIHELMVSCGIKAADLGAVAVAIGPGSFTGVRCGLAIAKGMAVSAGLPIFGASAFDVLLAGQPVGALPLIPVIEVGRGRIAAGRFEWRQGAAVATEAWKVHTWQELADAITAPAWVCGDVAPGLQALLRGKATVAPAPLNLRRAGWLAELGHARWQRGEADDAMTLTPIYP